MTEELNILGSQDEPIDKVFTAANAISFVRLCLAPVSLCLLLLGHDVPATILFAVTAATDFLDGQIARRTNTVSKIGQLLDPVVDRVLMICGVVGVMAVGRLPVWIVVLVLVRDVFLLVGGTFLMREFRIRVPVIYAGKFATTFLFVGIAGLMLNMPLVAGLGIVEVSWLPGLNHEICSWGIWFVYLGLILGLFTTAYYVVKAVHKLSHNDKQGVDDQR